jgi:hypothetical protein
MNKMKMSKMKMKIKKSITRRKKFKGGLFNAVSSAVSDSVKSMTNSGNSPPANAPPANAPVGISPPTNDDTNNENDSILNFDDQEKILLFDNFISQIKELKK